MLNFLFLNSNTFESAGESCSLDLECEFDAPPPCPPCSLVYGEDEDKVELDSIQMLFNPVAYKQSLDWFLFHCKVTRKLTLD